MIVLFSKGKNKVYPTIQKEMRPEPLGLCRRRSEEMYPHGSVKSTLGDFIHRPELRLQQLRLLLLLL